MGISNYLLIIVNIIWTSEMCWAMEGKIVGGSDAAIEKYPHSVFVAIECVTDGSRDIYVCGASIINQKFMLSAAHCFEDCKPKLSTVAVAVGTAQRDKVTLKVEDVTMHDSFDSERLHNDISIMMLLKELVFNSKVKKILLMKNPPFTPYAQVAGWGLIDEENEIDSVTLKEATQTLLPRETCVNRLGYLPRKAFCAENVKGYAAQGDSGSALITHRLIQIGIVSYKNDEVSSALVVYTNVSAYFDWITDTMENMYCDNSIDYI